MAESIDKILSHDQGVIVLPQTAFRVWGMNLPPTEFFQEEYISKYPRDLEISSEIYSMNKLLLEFDGHHVSQVYKRDEIIPFLDGKNIFLDCQAVNLMHHYKNLQHLSGLRILDYSSLGHRYVEISDIVPINHFIRALGRCFKFKQKNGVYLFWNWRKPWENKGWPISNFFWKNRFLDHDLLASKCKQFVEENISIFPEFSGLNPNSCVLLICPHTNLEFTEFLQDLRELLQSDSEALGFFSRAERIYVKQHRIAPHLFPVKFELLGKVVEVINQPLTRNLPSEILIIGMPNLLLFSTISSIVFAAQENRVKTLGKIGKRDRKDYGFMLGRAKRRWKHLEYPSALK